MALIRNSLLLLVALVLIATGCSASQTDEAESPSETMAADPCNSEFPDPASDHVTADLDGDGVADKVWLQDQTVLARFDDGRSIQSVLQTDVGQVSFEVSVAESSVSQAVVINLDDEPGDEIVVSVNPNNWWGAVPIDLDGCTLGYVPLDIVGELRVSPLGLGTSSASCLGLCSFSLACVPGVGLRHTQGRLADGVMPDEETGQVSLDETMVWTTVLWAMVDGRLLDEEIESGEATVADFQQIPELSNELSC